VTESAPSFLPDGRTRLLGIVGDPIGHSLSPRLHTAVLRRLGRNFVYVPFPVPEPRLEQFVLNASSFGVAGFNVTTPYKERVACWVRPLDAETERTGMVNTVRCGGVAEGYSTDGAGILSFLRAAGLGGQPFGVLGFGATARSLAARALADGAPLACVVSSRPAETAARLQRWGGSVPVVSWTEPAGLGAEMDPSAAGEAAAEAAGAGRGDRPGAAVRKVGVWVSTLPPDAAPLPAWLGAARGPDTVLCDLNYGPDRTALAEQARAFGWRACDGLGPLCHQGALSLGFWLGEEVPVELFRRALGRSLRSLRPAR